MNLVERHNIPIRFEDIKIGDKLIVSKVIDPTKPYPEHVHIGETVTVIYISICNLDYWERCSFPQRRSNCKCRCLHVENDLKLITTSCFHKLSSLSKKIII